jgi:hypothetical protein
MAKAHIKIEMDEEVKAAFEALVEEIKILRAELAAKTTGQIHYHFTQPTVPQLAVPSWIYPVVTYCNV